MVTLKISRMLDQKGGGQMEMMVVLGGMMSMLVVSLLFQHVSYRKVQVRA